MTTFGKPKLFHFRKWNNSEGAGAVINIGQYRLAAGLNKGLMRWITVRTTNVSVVAYIAVFGRVVTLAASTNYDLPREGATNG